MTKKFNLILLFVFIFVIYHLSSSGVTPYNYFVLLADQILKGKYYLVDNPPWLNELIPLKSGGFGIVYPPAPTIVAMPLVYLFGKGIPQNIISYFLGSCLAILIAKIGHVKSKSDEVFNWFLILSSFGTITWYLSSNGSVWYLGQISGAFFLTAVLYESLTKKRPVFVSTFFALAVLSRLQILLAIPIVVYLNIKNLNFKRIVYLAVPFTLLISTYLYYNFLRFGNIFETGYSLIPGVLDEPWYSKGIFHYSYLKRNLEAFLLAIPIFTNTFPYVKPSWSSLSILITTPAFIYSLLCKIKSKEVFFTYLSIVLIAITNFSHGGIGFTQFGYRYAVDFYPLIYLLLANYFSSNKIAWHHYLLLFISVIINLWGIIWINSFGWVSF